MGKILELLTVNVATQDLEATLAKWRKLGLATMAPAHMPQPPIEITDVTVPVGALGAISVIAPTGPGSPVQRFLDKRGAGAYSIAVRVDSLAEVMRDWASAGIEWVLPGAPGAAAGHAGGAIQGRAAQRQLGETGLARRYHAGGLRVRRAGRAPRGVARPV